MKSKRNSALWDYLEASGVLEKGTEEEIAAVRKSYRKQYLLKYKQAQRRRKPEFTVNFSEEQGEFSRVKHAARRHKLTITRFIHSAVLAYIEQTFIVPNTEQIIRLEQTLSECLNQVQGIVKERERYNWEREQKLESIEKIIIRLEEKINDIFRNPPLASHDSQSKVA